ncbi:PilZ domain-containing protein [Vreelandella jeotgali]|uniref:PilZ domain-containing protein n=1 Tax=Vreelandella jeotgali TaxID=553386 RepID=UPI00034B02E1|nr:PilZ domain-containing protein [Halomonas jeotgali]
MSTQKALALSIPDMPTLLGAYMAFLERGGLFVPTRRYHALGDPIVLLLTLPDDTQQLTVHAEVVWISPEGVSGRRIPGIGVHFSQQDYNVRDQIEARLAGQLDTAPPSYTL